MKLFLYFIGGLLVFAGMSLTGMLGPLLTFLSLFGRLDFWLFILGFALLAYGVAIICSLCCKDEDEDDEDEY